MNLPGPLEILMDPISLSLIGIYILFYLWESISPGKSLPEVKFWKIKGLLFFAFYFYLSTYLPLLWDGYFASYQLFDLSGLNVL